MCVNLHVKNQTNVLKTNRAIILVFVIAQHGTYEHGAHTYNGGNDHDA